MIPVSIQSKDVFPLERVLGGSPDAYCLSKGRSLTEYVCLLLEREIPLPEDADPIACSAQLSGRFSAHDDFVKERFSRAIPRGAEVVVGYHVVFGPLRQGNQFGYRASGVVMLPRSG